ncbi:sigma-54-dependent transcriptional regulator [Ligilactobacillus equi]|uniref:DNA translocase FtsK n=1 Tax=Ligilactobacillus equi DSM 15833 = JCM 10991 TaxID=1423740 RepID=A0A0R1TNS7_9LACO|nr:sigma-54-dependent transcriptional regulator [Ligilactobacillus equi]KRL80242.1 transcriptional regulator [Ligilactobacillus equi DSM 15833 = JCM 10991]
MKRKERVLAYLQAHRESLTTSQIAEALTLARPNVSKVLNDLVREKIIAKSSGRPVKYFLKENDIPTISKAKSQSITYKHFTVSNNDIFSEMIGSKGSLKTQVDQAKAALLYPPKGLNVLLTGPTGSGKTYFANTMAQFARNQEVIAADKPLVTFNCADYAHNPQLLMAHLFGYIKGAFTGAEENHAGLIQEAEGGILFLDEVHRLPPEGQEMIFYLMDHGTYSRLGETNKDHQADVRIVCATTEDPKSSLLATFVRRIPIIITMPSFEQRPVSERLQLMKYLFSLEASRIHKTLRVDENVVQALLGSVTFGNVGQLKSNLQLVCAQGFLDNINQGGRDIHLTFEQLPPQIKAGLSHLADNREELGKLAQLLQPVMEIDPQIKTTKLTSTDSYEPPYNLYEIIGDKAKILKDEGLDQKAINDFILTDINVHLKSFYHKAEDSQAEEHLNELVDEEIIQLTKEIMVELKQENYTLNNNFLYALSLHISSFIKRAQNGQAERQSRQDLESLVAIYPKEQEVAQKIARRIMQQYQIPVPGSEVSYLVLLLVSLKTTEKKGQIGVVVAAHGTATASSMVEVVTRLLQVRNLRAFDMDLDMSPKTAFQEIAKLITEVDQGNGVILLVDMGSLSTFSDDLSRRTGVEVKTLDLVTTALVLEAARKTSLVDAPLEAVYGELQEFRGYSRPKMTVASQNDQRPKVILATCATGVGTAEKIKGMLEEILIDNLIDDVQVVTSSILDLPEKLPQLTSQYQIVATTGIVRPEIEVPFMSLEELMRGNGENFIQMLMGQEQVAFPMEKNHELTRDAAILYLTKTVTFLNPVKVGKLFWDFCDYLEDKGQHQISNATRTNLIIHLGGACERSLLGNELTVPEVDLRQCQQEPSYQLVAAASQLFAEELRISLSEVELYYLTQIYDTQVLKK